MTMGGTKTRKINIRPKLHKEGKNMQAQSIRKA